jgi:hypothetical protein
VVHGELGFLLLTNALQWLVASQCHERPAHCQILKHITLEIPLELICVHERQHDDIDEGALRTLSAEVGPATAVVAACPDIQIRLVSTKHLGDPVFVDTEKR